MFKLKGNGKKWIVLRRGIRLFSVTVFPVTVAIVVAYAFNLAQRVDSTTLSEYFSVPKDFIQRLFAGQPDLPEPLIFVHLIEKLAALTILLGLYFVLCFTLAWAWTLSKKCRAKVKTPNIEPKT